MRQKKSIFKKAEEEIESEAKHVLRILWSIITYPLIPFLILFKKKKPADLLNPIKHIWKFFWDAKLTAWLIVMNLIVPLMIILLGLPDTIVERIFVFHPTDMFKLGSLNFLSIIGAGFMHGSLAHLTGNMLFLFVLGRVVEKKLGSLKMGLVYFISMIIAHIGSGTVNILFGDPSIGSVGASGAISGLASAAMLLSPFSFTYILFGVPIPIFLVAWISLITDISGVGSELRGMTNIGHTAHLAGFFAVIPLMMLMQKQDRKIFLRGVLINACLAVTALLAWLFLFR